MSVRDPVFDAAKAALPEVPERRPCFACDPRGVAPDDDPGSVRADPVTGSWICSWCDAGGNSATYLALGELTRQLELEREPWLAADQGGVRLGAIRDAAVPLLRRGVPLREVSALVRAVNGARDWPAGGPLTDESLAMALTWAAEGTRRRVA